MATVRRFEVNYLSNSQNKNLEVPKENLKCIDYHTNLSQALWWVRIESTGFVMVKDEGGALVGCFYNTNPVEVRIEGLRYIFDPNPDCTQVDKRWSEIYEQHLKKRS